MPLLQHQPQDAVRPRVIRQAQVLPGLHGRETKRDHMSTYGGEMQRSATSDKLQVPFDQFKNLLISFWSTVFFKVWIERKPLSKQCHQQLRISSFYFSYSRSSSRMEFALLPWLCTSGTLPGSWWRHRHHRGSALCVFPLTIPRQREWTGRGSRPASRPNTWTPSWLWSRHAVGPAVHSNT